MKHLSVDVGYVNLGYCISTIEEDKFVYLSSDYVNTGKKQTLQDRLKHIYTHFSNIITTCKITDLIYERPVFNRGASGAGVMNAEGVLILLAGQYNLNLHSYAATEVKKEISGSGKSDKQGVDDAVCKFLNLQLRFKADHESDAVAIAITHFLKKFR